MFNNFHGVFNVTKGNSEQFVELCAVKGWAIGNTWFKKINIHKYTYVNGRVGQQALVDCISIEGCVKERLLDVNMLEGAAGGMSDYTHVEARVEICRVFWKSGNTVLGRRD